jgi:hypothetical protein
MIGSGTNVAHASTNAAPSKLVMAFEEKIRAAQREKEEIE